jgi:hypothetical protein
MSEPTDIVSTSDSQLQSVVPEELKGLLSFESATSLAQFFEGIGWTPIMELQTIMDIIQTTPSEHIKLRAIKMLQERRADILKNSGLIVKATRTQKDGKGGQTVFSTDALATSFGRPSIPRSISDEPNEAEKSVRQGPETTVSTNTSEAAINKPPTGAIPSPDDGTDRCPDNSDRGSDSNNTKDAGLVENVGNTTGESSGTDSIQRDSEVSGGVVTGKS